MRAASPVRLLVIPVVLAVLGAAGCSEDPLWSGDGGRDDGGRDGSASGDGSAVDDGRTATDGGMGDGELAGDGQHSSDGAAGDGALKKDGAGTDGAGTDGGPAADGLVADGALPMDPPGAVQLASETVAKGWYQYYRGSTQYRPAGELCDLAVDSLGQPHLFHQHSTGGFFYRKKLGGGWVSDNDVLNGLWGYLPHRLSIALDGNDSPQVALGGWHYVNYPNWIAHAHTYRWDGYKWVENHLLPAVGTYVTPRSLSLALDQNKRPHLAYYGPKPPGNSGTKALIYAWWDGAAWQADEVSTDEVAPDEHAVDLALDVGGVPTIAFVVKVKPPSSSQPEHLIKVARRQGSSWMVQTAEDYLLARSAVALGLAPDGTPHLGYADDKYDDLYHATLTASGWVREKVDEQGEVGWGIALAVDKLGRPHLSYIDKTQKRLRYVRQLPTGWDLYAPATTYSTGQGGGYTTALTTALAIDGQRRPHILVGGFNLDYVVGNP